MQEQYSIEVNNIKKNFKIYYDKGHTLKEASLFKKRRSYELRPVLRGISFKVKKGEAVALIGHNGCGKSTTLKMLTRIMYPDEGSIKMRGRVSSLIELGAGFHPDMSGRENIFINASIFGLTHREIEERVAEIIEFSELEEYIDNPVRTYSSGMFMRLAFAVAINVDADILLIDEILAVGDAAFQAKCFNRLREIKGKGVTIVLVSHAMGQVEQLCDRSIWIHDGLVRAEGKPRDVDPMYLELLAERSAERVKAHVEKKEENSKDNNNRDTSEEDKEAIAVVKNRYGSGDVKISSIKMFKNGQEAKRFDTEDSCTIEVSYSVNKPIKDSVFGVQFCRNDGLTCYGTNTRIERFASFDIEKNGCFRFKMPRVGLISGAYWLDVAIESGEGIPVDYWKQAISFEVTSPIGDVDIARLEHEWESDVLNK